MPYSLILQRSNQYAYHRGSYHEAAALGGMIPASRVEGEFKYIIAGHEGRNDQEYSKHGSGPIVSREYYDNDCHCSASAYCPSPVPFIKYDFEGEDSNSEADHDNDCSNYSHKTTISSVPAGTPLAWRACVFPYTQSEVPKCGTFSHLTLYPTACQSTWSRELYK